MIDNVKIQVTPPYYKVGFCGLIRDPQQDFITTQSFSRAIDNDIPNYRGMINSRLIDHVKVYENGEYTIGRTEPGYIYVIANPCELRKCRNANVILLRLLCTMIDEYSDGEEVKHKWLDMTINLRQLGYGVEPVDEEVALLVSMPDSVSFDKIEIPEYITTNFLQRISYE